MLGKISSKWQNPFFFARNISDQTSLKLYEVYMRNEMVEQLSELEGKELGCWCTPALCHGDVLVKLVHELKEERDCEERKRKNERDNEKLNVKVCKTDSK